MHSVGAKRIFNALQRVKVPAYSPVAPPGRKIVKDVVAIAKCEEKSVSVAIEEINPEGWAEEVYRHDILNRPENLYRRPGYNAFG